MKTVEQARCLILDLPKSIDEYVASLSKSLRYDVRRLRGKALKERGATVEWISEASANNFADQFFALHRARWKSRGLPGAFFGKNEPFQRNWIIAGAKSGMVLMNRLVCEGSTVGTVYAMKHGNTCYFYQAGMEPTASSLSPGTILVSKMIERAIELGCDTFDFMRGDEPYKRRWKPNRERINHRILLPPPNVVGKAGMWWNSTAWRVELKVRDRLEGKSLRPTKVTNPNP
jgi:CelD/BcsL family acetyltransferase involved in cellulose biosynthesis